MSNPVELATVYVSPRDSPELGPAETPQILSPESSNAVTTTLTPPVDPSKDPANFPDRGWKAWSVVLGSHLGLIVNFGLLNSVGAVQSYVSTHQLAGVTGTTVSWVFLIYMCLPFLMGAVVGPIFDSQGATRLLALSTVLLFAGFMAVSWSSSIVAFLFSLSICVGLAHALAITPCISLVSHWFLLNRGKAIGTASLGGLVGGTIWPLVLRALYSSVGFGWAIRIVAFICLGTLILSTVLVKLRFRRSIFDGAPGTLKTRMAARYFFEFSAFKEPSFAFLVAGVFLTEIALLSILTYLASYAIAYGFDDNNSLYLLTALNATGIAGRYVPGHAADIIGNFNVMVLMLIGFCISIFAVWLPVGGSHGGIYAFACMCGFFSSSILSLTPVCLASITPVDKFGQRYGLMYTSSSTGILFGIPVAAAIIGLGSHAEYQRFAAFCGAFACAGTISWVLSRYCVVGARLNVKV